MQGRGGRKPDSREGCGRKHRIGVLEPDCEKLWKLDGEGGGNILSAMGEKGGIESVRTPPSPLASE